MNRAPRVPLILTLAALAFPAYGEESCPAPGPLPEFGPEAEEINVSADSVELDENGVSIFRGQVEVTDGTRRITANELRYDAATEGVTAVGEATFTAPGIELTGDDARYDPATGEASVTDAEFRLPQRPARGAAGKVTARAEGQVSMRDIIYTTCMDDPPDWKIQARELSLDTQASRGEARGGKLVFRGTPILYVPYISFPLDNTRKTGFLMPSAGNSDRGGTEVTTPFYWNIAPNYDLTVAPRFLSKRGVQFSNDFRYLTRRNSGAVLLEFLPSDDEDPDNDDRRYTFWRNRSEVTDNWIFRSHVEEVSDSAYFEDLGNGTDVTSQTHLLRNLQVDYFGDHWHFLGRVQNYQTIDRLIADADEPAERLPQLVLEGLWGDLPLGLRSEWYSELVNFTRDDSDEGWRVHLQPRLSLPIEGPGYFFEPAVEWRYIRYDLDREDDTLDDTPSLSAPIASLDAGLIFERDFDGGDFLQTLEPRMLYAHIPSRSQNSFPVFDTNEPDFNSIQLFRPNRFLGADRLGDTDTLSVGVTSRLLETESGREFLTATVGQAFYLSDRNVQLPDQTGNLDNRSDFIVELGLGIFRNWNADIIYRRDLDDSDTRQAEARVQYRPAANRVINANYRYQPDLLEQAEISLGWPVSKRWSFVGQIEYSIRDNTTIDRLLGLQYESCCWAARVATQRHISNRDGSADTRVLLQLEFKGLAGLGSDADTAFESDILGYSVYE